MTPDRDTSQVVRLTDGQQVVVSTPAGVAITSIQVTNRRTGQTAVPAEVVEIDATRSEVQAIMENDASASEDSDKLKENQEATG